MTECLRKLKEKYFLSLWFYPICLAVTALLTAFSSEGFAWLYVGGAAIIIYACRPTSALHSVPSDGKSLLKSICTVLVAAATIAVCVLPMNKLPIWNGEIPDHRNQYELMAESILDGRIDFAYDDDEALSQLENPYDPQQRNDAGVTYHWDHAYYEGNYYMYFGVVPVFLAFLPYRIITGTALTTYHATQLFVAAAIIGIFMLFRMLTKLFFKNISYSAYLSLSVAFSVMSVWYCTAEPALYCTAISAAIALEIWSLFFFVKGVWGEEKENRQIFLAGIGALLGALVFGCRPPIALANILVLPMLIAFFTQRKVTLKLIAKLIPAALPYAVVGVALMVYNYVRFDSPFEFGQAYQLTVADQTSYTVTLNYETVIRLINETLNNFFERENITTQFPYFHTSSVFFNFPILLFSFFIFKSSVLKEMKSKKILPLAAGLFASVIIITAMDILWTPFLLERYRMDIYFLIGILCFIAIGFLLSTCAEKYKPLLTSVSVIGAVFTTISSFLYLVQTVGNYYPEKVTEIASSLHLI